MKEPERVQELRFVMVVVAVCAAVGLGTIYWKLWTDLQYAKREAVGFERLLRATEESMGARSMWLEDRLKACGCVQ